MISVIMPAYNAEKYIASAIESILNQTYQAFELIIVDDGSTDSTVGIIRSYMENDSRIRLIQNEHGGANKARNTAIDAAQYEWIACLDADDVAYPERFEKQIAYLDANPDVVVLGSYMHQINVEGKIIGTIQIGPTSVDAFNAMDRARQVAIITNPTAIFSREIAIKVGCYDERLTAAQEIELWDRMSEFGALVVIPEPLIQYRLHGNSTSVNKFFDQRMYQEYITARHRARLAGHTLELEEYVRDYREKPLLQRLMRYFHNRGRLFYRNTGVYLSQKDYGLALLSLTASMIFSPKFSFSRILNRFFPRQFV